MRRGKVKGSGERRSEVGRVCDPLYRRNCAPSFFVLAIALALSVSAATPAPPQLIASPESGWPQFRGPRRDGVCDERGLLQTWPEGGPKLLWSAKGAGRGFSSTIVAGGRIYVTGDFGEETRILAYALDGQPLWSVRNGDAWLNQYPGARASVTFSAGWLYHFNAHGRLACLDAATGREHWAVDVLKRFRGDNITWGLSECLIVDERNVYVTAGGRDALLVAFDKLTGELRWQNAPLPALGSGDAVDGPSYTPPVLVRFAGRRLYIGAATTQLYCADADTGRLQWTRPRPTSYGVLAMTPALVGDGVFFAAPYGPPGTLHRLVAPASPDAPVGVADAWTSPLDTLQGSVVVHGGRIYGSFYPRRGGWVALDAATGAELYKLEGHVKGAPLWADGRLYALCEDGWLLLLEPTEKSFEIRGRFRLAPARDNDAWAHPVIVVGRLYLRYHDTVFCYDIRGPLV
ncbi:MAG: PQQ-like beta-propeller repeat protein [Verrucomicrobia bacterium]|nr:PQQ-like beta-propeller repeat protein [Verrucomicrobiota bacterium]